MPCVCQMHCEKARVKHCKSNSPPQIVEVDKKKMFVFFFQASLQFKVAFYMTYEINYKPEIQSGATVNCLLLFILHV